MANFTVWKFDDIDGAEKAAKIVKQAASEDLVRLIDHAVVTWPEGAQKPRVHGSHEDSAKSAGLGALWGVLFGAIFFLPILGAAAGAAIGGLTRALSDVGLKKDDLERVKEKVTPGTSALFVVSEERDLDRFGERLHGIKAELVSTNLTPAERSKLLETFGH